ncbi:MAG: response regulator [Thermodesulfovibrionales bacterium]|nr:response regulator [Thermodesulfovibrionales bacterium]
MTYDKPMELPRYMENSRSRPTGTAGARNGSVLIVDDEIDMVGVLHNFLEENGFVVVATLSARKALELMRAHNFDLLIADLVMPEMDGIELLNAAWEIDPDLIGIIMTGHGSIESAVDAMKAGAFDYLLKPFEFKMLLPICARAMKVRQLNRSEQRYRILVDELTLMVKKLQNSSKQPLTGELEIVELKEEIESLKEELRNYQTMEKQWMFYES